MLINDEIPTIVGILTFMSRINFVLSSAEYGRSCITSGPDFHQSSGVFSFINETHRMDEKKV